MTEIELSITRLAALGRSPHQIEVKLGLQPYTIHQKYHDALQAGYARAAGMSYSKSDELKEVPPEPIERRSNKDSDEKEAKEKQAAERELRVKKNRSDYYQKHKAEIRERQSQYRQANKEKAAECNRRYQQENKEKIAERKRRYRQANKEKIAEYKRRYNERKRKEKQEKEKHHGQEIGCLWAP